MPLQLASTSERGHCSPPTPSEAASLTPIHHPFRLADDFDASPTLGPSELFLSI